MEGQIWSAREEAVVEGWKSLMGVSGASITKDLVLFKDQIISDQMYLVGDILAVTTEETEIQTAFETETETDTTSRRRETAGNGTTRIKKRIAIEKGNGNGTEKRKKKGIDSKIGRRRRIEKRTRTRTEIERETETDEEMWIKATVAKRTTNTRESPPLVQRKA